MALMLWMAACRSEPAHAPPAEASAVPTVDAAPKQPPRAMSGLRYLDRAITGTEARAQVFVADLAKVRVVGLDARTDRRTVATVDALREESSAYVAVNGTFFDPERRPLGLLVSGGSTLSEVRQADWGVLTVDDRDRVTQVHTRDYVDRRDVTFAVQCGPRVVIEGTPPRLRPQVARRTGLCVRGPSELALFVVDEPVESNVVARWLAAAEADGGLGCTDAMLLDGGPSTALSANIEGWRLEVRGGWSVPNAVAFAPR